MNDLKPGRELDALIAEKVIGKDLTIFCPKLKGPCDQVLGRIHFEGVCPKCGWSGQVSNGPLLYSTSVSAAWEVVEKLKDETMSVSIFTTHVHGPEETEILIDGVEMCRGDFSIPHAICLGALKAIGDI